MKRWFVVHTQPNGETRALDNLLRQGFEPYLPCLIVKRRHARKVERVRRPLFPRYMFVRFDPDETRWRAINGTFGVSHLVTDGGTPAAVPFGIVEDIRAHEDDNGVIGLAPPAFRPGQALEILDGPMASRTGQFLNMPDRDRVILLLDLLGRSVRVTVPREAVTAA